MKRLIVAIIEFPTASAIHHDVTHYQAHYAYLSDATQFATELKVCGLRMVGNRIVCHDCLGIAWKP